MKTHTLGASLFVEFILTHERNETQNENDVNCYQCMGLKLTLSKISGPFKCLFMLYPAEDMLKNQFYVQVTRLNRCS